MGILVGFVIALPLGLWIGWELAMAKKDDDDKFNLLLIALAESEMQRTEQLKQQNVTLCDIIDVDFKEMQ